jgi:hypothetical protein
MTQTPKDVLVYKRDDKGHLICERCGFKPKATARHPNGNPSTMHYHMKKHTNDFPYECPICKTGFPQKMNLQNHMKARHPNETKEKDNMFKCPVENCSFQSITKGNCLIHCARRHFNQVVDDHIQSVTNNGKKTFHCTCCTKDFKSGTAFYYHILKCLATFQIIDAQEVEALV